MTTLTDGPLGSAQKAGPHERIGVIFVHVPPGRSAAMRTGRCGRRLDLHYISSRYPNGLPAGYPHAFYG